MDLQKKLQHYRLSDSEYKKICEILGREPKGVEWALFSALWSEHCSYKSSKIHLKKFYSSNERVKESFGENAGVIDLGEGEAIAFKMESHNHPSFISPHQGAATGVGGILRDIFTMGARPVALANYLCFGESTESHMPHLVDGVVRGIADYGNCVGVPMLTGQTEFHSSYNQNILVNAMAVGVFGPEDKICTSAARGVGNYVVYVGAKTGRDGVHGASMASESFDEENESKKPTVQIGDPFYEKLLIESCLEVMKMDLVEAIQDMGAAGLTSSSFEMSAKGRLGLTIHLDKVPVRDRGITPEEILLSESQERMLLICKPDNFNALKKVFERWSLDAAVIGQVKKDPNIDLYWKGECLTSIDPDLIIEKAPLYNRAYSEWESKNKVNALTKLHIDDCKNTFHKVLNTVSGCSRSWVYSQYDQRVGANTARDCSESVGVIRLKDSGRALGLTLGCRPYMMRMDAKVGGYDAIFRPSLQLAVKGFTPLAVTDCLNFGNPEKPEIMSEFVASIEAMSGACKTIDTPVISGNVSFYNETHDTNITSTPSTGVVGLRTSIDNIPSDTFKSDGESVYLLSLTQVKCLGLIAEKMHRAPQFTGELKLAAFKPFTEALTKLTSEIPIVASKVSGKYGLAYALTAMCTPDIGVTIHKSSGIADNDFFNETLYQVLISIRPEQEGALEALLNELQIDSFTFNKIGITGGNELNIEGVMQSPITELMQHYHSGWEKNFETLA